MEAMGTETTATTEKELAEEIASLIAELGENVQPELVLEHTKHSLEHIVDLAQVACSRHCGYSSTHHL